MIDGFGQIVACSVPHCLDSSLNVGIAGNHYDGQLRVSFPHLHQDFHPINIGHSEVYEQHIGFFGDDRIERRLSRIDSRDFKSLSPHDVGKDHTEILLIIGNKNPGLGLVHLHVLSSGKRQCNRIDNVDVLIEKVFQRVQHPEKKDACFAGTQRRIDSVGDKSVAPVEQGIVPAALEDFGAAASANILQNQGLLYTFVLFQKQVGRFRPHYDGALSDQVQKQPMISAPPVCEFLYYFKFTPTDRETVLIKTDFAAGKRQPLNNLFDFSPSFVDCSQFPSPCFNA
jgi:hypothetical protein